MSKQISIEEKIRERLKELEDLKNRTIEELKKQQQMAMGPIETAISELKALLPEEKEE